MANSIRDDLEVVVAPYVATQDWDDAVKTTLPALGRWEKESGKRAVIVQNQMDSFGGVFDDIWKGRSVISPRSKRPANRGPVLVYVPVPDAIQLAQRTAVTGLAVVALDDEWVTGWARAFGAFNLATGKAYEPFTEEQAELLDKISWFGYKGWSPNDSFIGGPVSHALSELMASGVTVADVDGAMYARNHSPESVKRLAKFA